MLDIFFNAKYWRFRYFLHILFSTSDTNFYTDCTGMAAAVDTSGDGNLMIKLAYKEKIPVATMRLNPSDKILF